jgi:hypothetical protein
VPVQLAGQKTPSSRPGGRGPYHAANRHQHAQRRQAELAITPLVAPSGWRDIHLGELFEAAGRDAAEKQIGGLEALARPLLG